MSVGPLAATPREMWKYVIPLEDEFELMMPDGAQIRHVNTQGASGCVWVEVDPDKPKVTRRFCVRGTGHTIDAAIAMRYLGTFLIEGGLLVFRLYERAQGS